MSENHIRGISVTLSLLDEDLWEFHQWAKGQEIRSVLYEVRNPLSAVQRQLIADRVAKMLEVLGEIKDTLNLEGSVHQADKMIVSSCVAQRAALAEIETGRLRRYGEVPVGLSKYIDSVVKALNADLRAISDAAGQSVGV